MSSTVRALGRRLCVLGLGVLVLGSCGEDEPVAQPPPTSDASTASTASAFSAPRPPSDPASNLVSFVSSAARQVTVDDGVPSLEAAIDSSDAIVVGTIGRSSPGRDFFFSESLLEQGKVPAVDRGNAGPTFSTMLFEMTVSEVLKADPPYRDLHSDQNHLIVEYYDDVGVDPLAPDDDQFAAGARVLIGGEAYDPRPADVAALEIEDGSLLTGAEATAPLFAYTEGFIVESANGMPRSVTSDGPPVLLLRELGLDESTTFDELLDELRAAVALALDTPVG